MGVPTPVFGHARRKECVVVRLYVFQLNICSSIYNTILYNDM